MVRGNEDSHSRAVRHPGSEAQVKFFLGSSLLVSLKEITENES